MVNSLTIHLTQTTKIHDNVVVGGYTVVSPGTEIMENTILGAASATMVGQVLDPNCVYMGFPARKFKEHEAKHDTSYSRSSKASKKEKKSEENSDASK